MKTLDDRIAFHFILPKLQYFLTFCIPQ